MCDCTWGHRNGWACAHLRQLSERLFRYRREGLAIQGALRDGVIGAGAVLPPTHRVAHFRDAPLADPRWTVATIRRWRAITAVQPAQFLFLNREVAPAVHIEADRVLWRPETLDYDLLAEAEHGELHVYSGTSAPVVLARYRATTRTPTLLAERLSLWALVAHAVRLRALRRLLAECPSESWSPFTRRAIAVGASLEMPPGEGLRLYQVAASGLPVEERLRLALQLCARRYSVIAASTARVLLESFDGGVLREFDSGSSELFADVSHALGWVAIDAVSEGHAIYGAALLKVLGYLIDGETELGWGLRRRIEPEIHVATPAPLLSGSVTGEFTAWLLGRPNTRLRELGRQLIAEGKIATRSWEELLLP